MGRTLVLREATAEERTSIERLAHSRTAPTRAVERAEVALAALKGEHVGAIAECLKARASRPGKTSAPP